MSRLKPVKRRQSRVDSAASAHRLAGALREKILLQEVGFQPHQLITFNSLTKERLLGTSSRGEPEWTWSDRKKAIDLLIEKGVLRSVAPRGYEICARRLKISLVVSNRARPFVQAVETAVATEGADVVVFGTKEDPKEEVRIVTEQLASADGVLLNPVMIPDRKAAQAQAATIRKLFENSHGRLVLIDRPFFDSHPQDSLCLIQTDNVEGGRLAAEYLFRAYRERFEQIVGKRQAHDPGTEETFAQATALHCFCAISFWTRPELERMTGFSEVIYERLGLNGWPSNHRLFRKGEDPIRAVRGAAAQWICDEVLRIASEDRQPFKDRHKATQQRLALPYTCFCVNDELAHAVFQELLRRDALAYDLRPLQGATPRVMVLGFDALPVYRGSFPSVPQPFEEMGRRAARLLIKHIHAGTAPERESRILLRPTEDVVEPPPRS